MQYAFNVRMDVRPHTSGYMVLVVSRSSFMGRRIFPRMCLVLQVGTALPRCSLMVNRHFLLLRWNPSVGTHVAGAGRRHLHGGGAVNPLPHTRSAWSQGHVISVAAFGVGVGPWGGFFCSF